MARAVHCLVHAQQKLERPQLACLPTVFPELLKLFEVLLHVVRVTCAKKLSINPISQHIMSFAVSQVLSSAISHAQVFEEKAHVLMISRCFSLCVKSFMEKRLSPFEKECMNQCV